MNSLHVSRAVVLAVAASVGGAATAFAQDSSVKLSRSPTLMATVRYDTPTASFIALTTLIPTKKPFTDSDWGLGTLQHAIEVEASYGAHGARLSVGAANMGKSACQRFLFGVDLMANVAKTWGHPTRGGADSTYVGGEAGYVFMSVRTTIGFAHRVSGPKGPDATIFTWSAGIQIPLKW